jgi:hypothetical protein
VRVLDPLSRDPVVSVERDERVTRVDMSAILRQFVSGRTGQPTVHNSGQVMDGLRCWVDTMPVSDREAAAHGIRLVTWADPARTSLALDVVAPEARPSARDAVSDHDPQRLQPRAVASHRARSGQLRHVDCALDGTALIWRHQDPRLSGVIFADPDPVRRWPDGAEPGVRVHPRVPGRGRVPQRPLCAWRRKRWWTIGLLTFPAASHLKWKKG